MERLEGGGAVSPFLSLEQGHPKVAAERVDMEGRKGAWRPDEQAGPRFTKHGTRGSRLQPIASDVRGNPHGAGELRRMLRDGPVVEVALRKPGASCGSGGLGVASRGCNEVLQQDGDRMTFQLGPRRRRLRNGSVTRTTGRPSPHAELWNQWLHHTTQHHHVTHSARPSRSA